MTQSTIGIIGFLAIILTIIVGIIVDELDQKWDSDDQNRTLKRENMVHKNADQDAAFCIVIDRDALLQSIVLWLYGLD